jgi:hypothetical protein
MEFNGEFTRACPMTGDLRSRLDSIVIGADVCHRRNGYLCCFLSRLWLEPQFLFLHMRGSSSGDDRGCA